MNKIRIKYNYFNNYTKKIKVTQINVQFVYLLAHYSKITTEY